MISAEAARERLLALIEPVGEEISSLAAARGRVLARPVFAKRDQPPFPSAAMDGYAIKWDEAKLGARFAVVGESHAGRGFAGTVGPGEAVRVLTGAPMPDGADSVVIQENVERDGDAIAVSETPEGGFGTPPGAHVRPRASDFAEGAELSAPTILGPRHVALLAAMNVDSVPVARKPRVSLVSTGDELVAPGQEPGPHQIVASNALGLAAIAERAGAEVDVLPIAPDRREDIGRLLENALERHSADLIVTTGGASVGDRDLVADTALEMGLEPAFERIAMRPGKPVMAGRLRGAVMLALPGNPVSALVCGRLFMAPAIRALLGIAAPFPVPRSGRLGAPVGPNGAREHYMRATVDSDGRVTAFENQDSSLLATLAQSNALLVRPPGDPARPEGAEIRYLPM